MQIPQGFDGESLRSVGSFVLALAGGALGHGGLLVEPLVVGDGLERLCLPAWTWGGPSGNNVSRKDNPAGFGIKQKARLPVSVAKTR